MGVLCEHLNCLPSELGDKRISIGDSIFLTKHYQRKERKQREMLGNITGGSSRGWVSKKPPVTGHRPTRR